jgi:AcrR family transcriptional regulator
VPATTYTAAFAEQTDDGQQRRVIEAALRCVARWGVGKTTLDDVAREAGMSRATLYRAVPGKLALLEVVQVHEIGRFFHELAEGLDGAASLEDLLVAGYGRAAAFVRDNDALRTLLTLEPELIRPSFAFHRLDRILASTGAFVQPYLVPFVGLDRAPAAAELIVRVGLSYVFEPSPALDLTDEAATRRFVATYLIPGLDPQEVHP